MNKDRGIIKWMPFNSIIGEKQMIEKLVKEKQKIKKPILSLEQQKEIEDKLLEIFYEQIESTFKIYQNGFIITLKTKIKSMDYAYKKIELENHKTILFTQIIEIML